MPFFDPFFIISQAARKLKARYVRSREEGVFSWARIMRVAGAAFVVLVVFNLNTGGSASQELGIRNQGGGTAAGSEFDSLDSSSFGRSRTGHPLRIPDSPDLAELSARAIYVIDSETNVVLAERSADRRLSPASTTKIATALVALEEYALDEKLSVSEECVGLPARRIGYPAGKSLAVEELLYDLLTQSAADAACALSLGHNRGSGEFVKLMNDSARGLGLENTHFTNPTGLDGTNGDHYSSAKDLVTLAGEALEGGVFRKIVGTREGNTNELLRTLPGTTGVKTGWTDEAGGCLVFSVERSGREIVGAILGSEDRFGEATAIVEWIYRVYEWPTP